MSVLHPIELAQRVTVRLSTISTPTSFLSVVTQPVERWLAQRLQTPVASLPIEIALWNGDLFSASKEPYQARITIPSRQTRHRAYNDWGDLQFKFPARVVARSVVPTVLIRTSGDRNVRI